MLGKIEQGTNAGNTQFPIWIILFSPVQNPKHKQY